jgi:hypothetical protein
MQNKRLSELIKRAALMKEATRVMDMIRGDKLSPASLSRLGIEPPKVIMPTKMNALKGTAAGAASKVLGGVGNMLGKISPKAQAVANNAASGLNNYATAANATSSIPSEQIKSILAAGREPSSRLVLKRLRNSWEADPMHLAALGDIAKRQANRVVEYDNMKVQQHNENVRQRRELGLEIREGEIEKYNPKRTVEYPGELKSLEEINLTPKKSKNSTWVDDLMSLYKDERQSFSYSAGNRVFKLPDIRRIKSLIASLPEEHRERILDGVHGVTRHEFSHGKQYSKYTPEQLKGMMNILHTKLAPTYKYKIDAPNPNAGFLSILFGADGRQAADETLGHFLATRGKTRGARAATNLPIDTMRTNHPQVLARWEEHLAGVPENLKRRLLATRAHTYLNYGLY